MASYGLVQIRYDRNRPSGQPAEDVMVNTLHCQVTDGGWTTDDRDAFMSAFGSLWVALRPYISSDVHVSEIRFYNMPTVSGPVGDPAFTHVETLPGTGSAAAELPPQVAASVTWITAIRRRWGRIYLPGLVNTVLDHGRFSTTFVGVVATAIDAFGTALRGDGQGLVVWHRSSWTPTDTTEYRVDDVPDVIRRRRFSQKFYFISGSFV
jgi:hypothetical protein